jgi:tRNA 2-thiouridine synthesizing protein A
MSEQERAHDAAVRTDAPAQPAVPVETLDCLGLFCPMPVLRLAGAMRQVQIGDEVELLADDPASRVDVPVWCRTRDQELLSVTDRPEGGWSYRVRRAR